MGEYNTILIYHQAVIPDDGLQLDNLPPMMPMTEMETIRSGGALFDADLWCVAYVRRLPVHGSCINLLKRIMTKQMCIYIVESTI